MFCDLVGSTALSTGHDPEDLRELIDAYHRAVADTVGHFDGYVANGNECRRPGQLPRSSQPMWPVVRV
jgi:hypothetical protein